MARKVFVKEEPDGEWREQNWEVTEKDILESYNPGEIHTFSYKVEEVGE